MNDFKIVLIELRCYLSFLKHDYKFYFPDKFCFQCILRWTQVVSHKLSLPPSSVKCPLCKRENFSIIHGYDGISFQRHYLNQNVGNNSGFYSEAHKYRLQCYYVEADSSVSVQFNVVRYWKSRKYLQPNRWLQSWLRREIQALIQEEDVEIIVHHILGVIDSLRSDPKSQTMPEVSRENFKKLVLKAATPFLSGRADRFVNEMELFLASGLNIEAYDKVYMHSLGWKQNPDEQEELVEHNTVTPYLHFFDEDLDEI